VAYFVRYELSMMSLHASLEKICPSASAHIAEGGSCDLLLVTSDDVHIPCHSHLLRARCSSLPEVTPLQKCAQPPLDQVLEVPECSSVVLTLLRWVYAAAIDARVIDRDDETDVRFGLGSSASRLGSRWGLLDIGCLQSRVAGRRCAERCRGSLQEDVLSAYDAEGFGSELWFFADEDGSEEGNEPVYGGFCEILKGRSAYFRAMLSGQWAESSPRSLDTEDRTAVNIGWPRDQLKRLIRFLHGATFIQCADDLMAAVECAKFFEVPSLLVSVHAWIACNLSVSNCPSMWKFMEAEPALKLSALDEEDDVPDADEACFDFLIHNFELLARAENDDNEEAEDVPLHELTVPQLQRLLSSGLIDTSTLELNGIVKRFAKAHSRGESPEVYTDLLANLGPPAVLFNRQIRDSILPQGVTTARSFV